MSRINRLRIINLKYNHDSMQISDELFDLNGQSTLLTLRNGGGKSVLVQMMMAPFVHRRYRDLKDRPFASYFTTARPSFILVEWKLDGGGGYVLTGMMVRRNPEPEASGELDITNFITEYQDPDNLDIKSIPITEKGPRGLLVKGYVQCRQMFDGWKKEAGMPFFSYDMNQPPQARQYFEKLAEYDIFYREWETIIHKVNLEESGLSNLFADCKNEAGLVEKWFLDAVEKKLMRNTDSMKEFRSIMGKYAAQYKENKTKIQRKTTIEFFEERANTVQEAGARYAADEAGMREQEAAIACFRDTLGSLLDEQETQQALLSKEQAQLAEEARVLLHQKYSAVLVKNQDAQMANQEEGVRLRGILANLEETHQNTVRTQNLYTCAQRQESLDEAVRDLAETNEKLRVVREKNRDLAPEREQLGAVLAGYYQDKRAALSEEQAQQAAHLEEVEDAIHTCKREHAATEQRQQELAGTLGGMRERLRQYDKEEERFNKRHQLSLVRNVIGEYDEALLTEQALAWKDQQETLVAKQRQLAGSKEKAEQDMRAANRRLTNVYHDQTVTEEALRHEQEQAVRYEKEMDVRREILRYFGVQEKDLYDIKSILDAADAKIRTNEEVRKGMAVSYAQLEREYRQLAGGEVVELSDDFRHMLEESGISCIYGMEWLAKNKNTERQNRLLVRRYPFLPYALLMSAAEAERLRQLTVRTHTSTPIPILLREELAESSVEAEEPVAAQGGVIDLDHVSFYLCFNESLLNQKERKALVEAKEQEMRRLREAAAEKDRECQTYYEQRGILANQTVSREVVRTTQEKIKALKEAQTAADTRMEELRKQILELETKARTFDKEIRKAEAAIRASEQLLEEYETLMQDYASYLDVLRQKHQMEEEAKKLTGKLERLQAQQAELETDLRQSDARRHQLVMEEAQLGKAAAEYAGYAVIHQATTDAEAETLAARYQVITAKVTGEQQELERQARNQTARMQKRARALEDSAAEYGFRKKEWQSLPYSQENELKAQKVAAKLLKEMQDVQKKIAACEKESGALEEKASAFLRQMEKETGMTEPLDKADILVLNFEEALARKRHEEKTKEQALQAAIQRGHSYAENLTALAEFDNLTRDEDMPLDETVRQMTDAEIKRQQGQMKRDHTRFGVQLQKDREELNRLLAAMMREEQLQEDFFQKPLQTLQELTASSGQLLSQLAIVRSSFHHLIEKLMVDIAMVEKEKARITEIMEDYLRRVYFEMKKIDEHSTIMIRNRPVKMLKIGTPDWEENAAMYQLRLRDYIDGVTSHCVGLLEENRNIEEYLGVRITTKALYDAVVGIKNVTIRMYKIEAEREYPITWAEVARNSGGEGFLSAFVILTSLLYYLRRKDSDLFAERKESKVLIMDNPFAQTNASHLLIPLMEVAKKSGTQLICLTGLGGESIYNRFENIYVLNLYSSNLRSGMQYLKAEHERGSADETMMVSNIRVTGEQIRLF